MDYFDTLVMYSFMLTMKPSRSLKKFISKQVYVVNLHSTVMALHFGDTRCVIRTSLMGWSQHQHLRLIRTQHLAQSAWPLLHWEHINEHAVCAKCCVPINRKCWCCDWSIGDILVQHRVPPKGSVITAGSRLPTYTFSEIKFFFLDGFWILKRVFSWNWRVSK